MKVIDLLKKRENNEQEYFKFFVKHEIEATKDDSINWVFENGEISSQGESFYDYLESGVYKLNHIIEIIEEDKDIEELIICVTGDEYLVNKINELVRVYNKLKGKYE